MLRSELLEREAEARRIALAETFDELRSRATPGHVLDQLVDYATDSGGADFFRNLRDQAVANPLALGLVGAGLAWLMLSNGKDGHRPYGTYEGPYGSSAARSRMRSYFASARERTGGAMSDARDRVSDAAHMASDAAGSITASARHARDAALETASHLRDAAGSAASSLRDATSSTYEHSRSRVGDTTAAFGNAASAVYGGVAQSAGWTASGMRAFTAGTAATGRDMADFARDQPLVLMGLGVALGAAVGAAFPPTDTERQLMGEASDDLKEQTRAFAAEQYDKSRSVAEAVLDDVQNRIKEGSQPSTTVHAGIVPLEEEITEIKETFRPERIGLRDGRN
jgi:uncharacterized protein DUF3618